MVDLQSDLITTTRDQGRATTRATNGPIPIGGADHFPHCNMGDQSVAVPPPGPCPKGEGGPGPPSLAGLALVNSLGTPPDTSEIPGRLKPYLRNTAVPRTIHITRERNPGDPRDVLTSSLSEMGARLSSRRNKLGIVAWALARRRLLVFPLQNVNTTCGTNLGIASNTSGKKG